MKFNEFLEIHNSSKINNLGLNHNYKISDYFSTLKRIAQLILTIPVTASFLLEKVIQTTSTEAFPKKPKPRKNRSIKSGTNSTGVSKKHTTVTLSTSLKTRILL